VRNSGVVYEDVDAPVVEQLFKTGFHLSLIRDVTSMRRSRAAGGRNLPTGFRGSSLVHIKDVNHCPMRSELGCDGTSDATASAGHNCGFVAQPESICSGRLMLQSDTPRFQGIKSSWPFPSALVRTWPLAT